MKHITILALLAVLAAALSSAGCTPVQEIRPQATQAPAEEPREPIRVVAIPNGPVLACVSEPGWSAPKWRSVCAPLGAWMPCVETEERIECRGDGGRPAARRFD